MALITAWGTITVAVVIDTDDQRVTSVHAMDEHFELDHFTGPRGQRIGGSATKKAAAVMSVAERPVWAWGW